jgi:hypothetical protein
MRVEIDLEGLDGRRLTAADQRIFQHNYRFSMPRWRHHWEGPRTELIANPRQLSARAARELFARSGLEVSEETLARLQEGIGR